MGGSQDQSSSLWLKCLGRIDHSLSAVEVTANMRRQWLRQHTQGSEQHPDSVFTSSSGTSKYPVNPSASSSSQITTSYAKWKQSLQMNLMNTTLKNGYNEPSRGPVTWLSRLCKLDNPRSVPGTHRGRWELLRMKHLLVSFKRLALTMLTKNSWAPGIFLPSLLRSWNHKAHHFFSHSQHKSSISAMMEGFIILE